MTAEIAVLNKSGVALAADSKVTITTSGLSKTYDTVNKVFTLSKVHPVGIMIFGNAEFMQYPWETIIKLYRKEIKNSSFDTVEQWSENFRSYLSSFGSITEDNKIDNIDSILSAWFSDVENACYYKAELMSLAVPSVEYIDILIEELKSRAERFEKFQMKITKPQFAKIIKDYNEGIFGAIGRAFGGHNNQDLEEAALSFSVRALCTDVYSPQSSGFVIAGYGDKEYFPTIISFNTDGYVGEVLKISDGQAADLSRENPSAVCAFAQRDMAQRFMTGVDPKLLNFMQGAFAEALYDSCMAVLDSYGMKKHKTDEVRTEIENAIGERAKDIAERTSEYIKERFSEPVIDMVAVLPKDELAHLAESLVALTSLQRRVSSGVETVGGPIDVALISKGDGFVWIKRKHYFTPELNLHYAVNYMRDLRKEES